MNLDLFTDTTADTSNYSPIVYSPPKPHKPERMTYHKAIQENMRHIGTDISEWTALEITGYHTDDKGRKLPEYNFPANYSPAPSLYQNEGFGIDSMNCELCGHPIKLAYYIKHDGRQLLMIVGSECITHFGEKSGNEMLQVKSDEIRRQEIRKIKKLCKYFREKHQWTRQEYTYSGYKRTLREWKRSAPNVGEFLKLEKSLENIHPDKKFTIDPTGQAGITRWHNKNYETAFKFFKTNL